MSAITIANKCVICGKPFSKSKGHLLVAVDGIFIEGKVTDLEPIFTEDRKRLYKNYFVHPKCKHELIEYLNEKINNT